MFIHRKQPSSRLSPIIAKAEARAPTAEADPVVSYPTAVADPVAPYYSKGQPPTGLETSDPAAAPIELAASQLASDDPGTVTGPPTILWRDTVPTDDRDSYLRHPDPA